MKYQVAALAQFLHIHKYLQSHQSYVLYAPDSAPKSCRSVTLISVCSIVHQSFRPLHPSHLNESCSLPPNFRAQLGPIFSHVVRSINRSPARPTLQINVRRLKVKTNLPHRPSGTQSQVYASARKARSLSAFFRRRTKDLFIALFGIYIITISEFPVVVVY